MRPTGLLIAAMLFDASITHAQVREQLKLPAPKGGQTASQDERERAANTESSGRVFALLIGRQRDEQIGVGVTVSSEKLRGLLDRTFKSKLHLSTVGLDGGDFTVAAVDSAILNLKSQAISNEDAVFCYVMTHGAYDPDHAADIYEKGHWFETDLKEGIPRVNLIERLQGLGARMTILISDSCNVPVPIPRFFASSPSELGIPAFYSLINDFEGTVSINSSSPGQFSFYDEKYGGLFSEIFITALKENHTYDSWDQFRSHLGDVIVDRYPNGITYLDSNGFKKVQPSLVPISYRNSGWVRKIR